MEESSVDRYREGNASREMRDGRVICRIDTDRESRVKQKER
jgi:hypothetical protein